MKKILYIDDDKINIVLAKRILSKNYEIIDYSSPIEALEFLSKNYVDLILLDIQMPIMNGFEVINFLQNDKNLKNIPVIFVTADDSEETKKLCLEKGAKDFLSRPFIPKVMEEKIESVLLL